MKIIFRKDIRRNTTIKILKGILHPNIQQTIEEFTETFNLVNISKYIYIHTNEHYTFLYVKDVHGNSHRIDILLD